MGLCFSQGACFQAVILPRACGALSGMGRGSGIGSGLRHREHLQARGAPSAMQLVFRHWECLQAQRAASCKERAFRQEEHLCSLGMGHAVRHREWLQAWCMASGMGRGFRQEEVLCHSGKGNACAFQAGNAPSCTGSSVRLRAFLQAWGMPLESAGAIQARGVPSDKGSAFRHWRLCPVSTEPGALCWEYGAWRGFLGFYVSLSVLPQEALW